MHISGFVPSLETNFRDFSRTQIEISRALKFTLTPINSQDLNVNSPYCLPYTSYVLVKFNRFIELSRTSGLFPGLSSPGKCYKIPGLSRFPRARTNPVSAACISFPWTLPNIITLKFILFPNNLRSTSGITDGLCTQHQTMHF